MAKGGYGRKGVVVRINSLDSPWGEDDISEVAKLTLDAVVIPKVCIHSNYPRTVESKLVFIS